MSVKRNFSMPMSTLLYEGNLIMTAGEDEAAFATKRLNATLLADARALWTALGGKGGSAGADIASTHEMTLQEQAAYLDMLDLFGALKSAAKRAFRDDDVKLREQFKVGINAPKDLGSVLARAKAARDSAQLAGNVAPLKDKGGWVATDAAALDAAISSVEHFDMQQHGSATVGIADTDSRNTAANTLHDNLRTIQGAADLEWPEREPANRAQREKFRIGFFPPSRPKGPPPVVPPSPPPTV